MAFTSRTGAKFLLPCGAASTLNVFTTKFGRLASPRPGPPPGNESSASASSLKAVMPVRFVCDGERVSVCVRRIVGQQHRIVVELLEGGAFGRLEVQ